MQKVLVIHDFMLKDKKLKGARLLIYALVYSYCSIDNNSMFFMKTKNIADFLNIALSSVYDNLLWLVDNNYISVVGDSYKIVKANYTPFLKLNEETIKIARTKWVNK